MVGVCNLKKKAFCKSRGIMIKIKFWISAFADNVTTSGLCNINGIEETSKRGDCHCKDGFSGDTCFDICEEGKFGTPGHCEGNDLSNS